VQVHQTEKKIAKNMAGEPRTPAALGKAIKQSLHEDVLAAWDMYFFGNKKRTWKGIEAAARTMHRRASFDCQVRGLADQAEIEAAANAVLLIVSQISGPAWRDRKKREKAWDEIGFCRLCWRLCASGTSTSRRPPLCDHHKPRTPEYQRHQRLKARLPPALVKVREAVRKAGGHESLKRNIPDNMLNALPHLSLHAQKSNVDPQSLPSLLNLLMLEDVEDPCSKISETVDKWKDGGEWAMGTLIHAEAWLSLLSEKKHGGSRPGAGRPKK